VHYIALSDQRLKYCYKEHVKKY